MKLFVTDYASYNNGTQFKHGHWVDLTNFNDAEGFNEYLKEHFNKVGIEDPEIMFTDFEGFPRQFYSESYDSSLIEKLYQYKELDVENWGDSEWVNAHNEYCSENNSDDQIYDFDDDFFTTYFAEKPMEAARAASFGTLNWSDDYIRFNGYGTLESTNDPKQWIDESIIIEHLMENA